MSKEHSRKEIDGIDPKTYGGFDKFMDGARKVTKYILPVLGASLMAGCNAQMLEAIARKAQAPEVSVLPSDLTATPGEVVVEMPTLTPEPSLTATIPSTATETQVPTSEIRFTEFSRRYFPSYKENYVAEIEGMQIPIDLGLSYWVTARPDNPIKTAHIAEDIVPILAKIYLKSCHYRFTNMMEGNEKVTYEEYVELVREGKGNLEMYVFNENKNDRFPELMSIDPKEGFALSLVDELLPLEMPSGVSLYVGSDGSGKLFTAFQITGGFIKIFFDDFPSSKKEVVWTTIFGQIYQGAFDPVVAMENDCLKYANSSTGKCGPLVTSKPKIWLEITQEITDEAIKQIEGKRGPIFEVTQE